MPLKIFRAVWFLSVLALFATLLYGYAGWQENMIVQDDASEQVSIGREFLFYLMVGTFVLVNVLVYLMAKMFPREENFRAWFHGLIITINVFFMIGLNLLGLYNSAERFDYSRIGFIIYGSVGLVVLWAAAWPLYALIQKIFVKEAI